MKALILAAGFGSRLAPITDHCPKALVPVNGKPIIIKQIENLYKNNVMDITVVSGYKAEVLEKAIHNQYPNVCIIESLDYKTTNNMYSAWLAREMFFAEPFIMMNADVFFDASVIETLLEYEADNAIVTDIGRYLDESMKVVENKGRIIEISKTIPPEKALGCSVDIYKFSAQGSAAFFKQCSEYIEIKKELNKWSEVALDDILSDITFNACPLQGRWVEIDNYDDLRLAEEIFVN